MIEVTVRGVMDDETPAGEYMFYDLYDAKGNCMNEGEPFNAILTRLRVAEYFILQYVDKNRTSWLAIHALDVLNGIG